MEFGNGLYFALLISFSVYLFTWTLYFCSLWTFPMSLLISYTASLQKFVTSMSTNAV